MNTIRITREKVLTTMALLLLPFAGGHTEEGSFVIGVTEPIEEIELAFPDAGIIEEIAVKEGEQVKEGDLLASLDSRMFEAREKVAAIRARSEAAVRSAKADLRMKAHRLEKLRQLGAANTNPDELARAEVDHEIALSQAELVDEEAAKAKIEWEQAQVELERRRLRSPINGIITLVTRDVAERVSAETTVVTVVNLSDLDLVVHVPAELSESLEAEKTLPVERVGVISGRNRGEAVVTFVSPVVDASSGTRRVRLRLANEEGNHVAGVKYRVGFPADLSLSAN